MVSKYAPAVPTSDSFGTSAATIPPGICDGVVVGNVAQNGLISVRLNKYGRNVDCVWAAGILSGLLGFKTTYIPPKKTPVLVYITGTNINYIIGNPAAGLTDTNNQTRTITGPGAPNNHTSQIYSSHNHNNLPMFASQKPPVDLVEGEIDISNLLNVGLTLLRNMASLQAGDLARVECCLLDDMVRIISDTFKHYTAFGDYKISNDGGKLNVVWHGTSHDFEAWGNKNATDTKLNKNAKADALDLSTIDGVMDDGRWRFSQYVGWLGNLVSIFVTDPVNAVGKIAAGQFRSGKAHLHINNDGAVLIQSVADIVLEKVVAIPVPNPLKLEDDPAGNRSDQLLGGQNNLSTWKPSDSSNLFEMAFQLREYARWLNNTSALSRFRQLNLDWEVPTEAQTPAPDLNSSEPDKALQNAGINNWRIVYSTIRIYRDGSIQTVDAYGNSITTTQTGIQISSAQDILLQAAGSVNIIAGRDVNVNARNNINLSAITQALRLKAETGLQLFCNTGNIVLEVVSKYLLKIIGLVNANNTAQLDTTGNLTLMGGLGAGGTVISSGEIQALKVSAAITRVNDGHDGHLFQLEGAIAPSIPSDGNDFQYQSVYTGPPLYQSITDQMYNIGDIKGSAGTWNPVQALSTKGYSWPGTVPMKAPISKASLNKPFTGAVPPATTEGMTNTTFTIHYVD